MADKKTEYTLLVPESALFIDTEHKLMWLQNIINPDYNIHVIAVKCKSVDTIEFVIKREEKRLQKALNGTSDNINVEEYKNQLILVKELKDELVDSKNIIIADDKMMKNITNNITKDIKPNKVSANDQFILAIGK